ncbi:FecR domain-containing protein [Methylotenera sp. 1P/1]|uniref:FecR domain-containing protein n=1 Tax=Methylotenera sp. 1P/1 TaxID=1131551 RepID=UPI00036C51F2|nr:FecR domain-containing protein [Methylotenera sp. 1P/1]
MTNTSQISTESTIVQEAVKWMVTLQSGIASEDDLLNCEKWRKQSQTHEETWQQLVGLSGNLKSIPKALAHATLDNSEVNRKLQSRRLVLKSVLLLAGSGTLAYSGYQFTPWQQMIADHGTAVGEQRKIMLADGTELHLNTDSAVDIHFDAQQRQIKLLKGEVLITTGHQSYDHRPFSIQTTHGNVRALGTRFLVHQQENTTFVAVYESAVEVRPIASNKATRLKVGEQLSFDTSQAYGIMQADQDLSAWSDGVIVAKELRLADFAKELDRYRSGKIICNASVVNLKISGVFPINDPDRVIKTLENTLPIVAEKRMHFWITLNKRS